MEVQSPIQQGSSELEIWLETLMRGESYRISRHIEILEMDFNDERNAQGCRESVESWNPSFETIGEVQGLKRPT